MNMETMEGEMGKFLKVLIMVSTSLTYCYLLSSRVPKGLIRLFLLMPIVVIFAIVPLYVSSVFLQYYIGFFISWFANFKLFLIAFGYDDPLSTDPSISLPDFILVTSLPIEIEKKPCKTKGNIHLVLPFVINVIIWSIMLQLQVKTPNILINNPILVNFVHTLGMFVSAQIVFTIIRFMVTPFLKYELRAQFDNPLFSTSIQNFWGKRWNLATSSLLKSTIFTPTKTFFTPILGRRWTIHVSVLITFLVSGLMHEVAYFYVTHQWPAWDVTGFFVIQGVCTVIEMEVKKKASGIGWSLHPMISWPLTLLFLAVTSTCYCYNQLVRTGSDKREIEEYRVLVNYIKRTLHI